MEETVIVELKAHLFTITRDEQAQVIEYFATFEHCPVALYFNFGRPWLEWHRLFPPMTVQTSNVRKWGKS
ncbi:MAG: GxxExxY protein [Anaerolineae bacterium]